MKTRHLLAPMLLGACALLEPDLEQYGYSACAHDDDCAPSGRLCEMELCSPPPWWDKRYKFRRELVVTNPGVLALPRGFPVTLKVGGTGVVAAAEGNARARLVALDRTLRTQVELAATVDNINNATGTFDLLFALPAELPAGGKLAGIWLYGSDEDETEPRPDGRAQLYRVDEDFEDSELDRTLWDQDGPAVFTPPDPGADPPEDGVVTIQRDGFLWTTVGLPGTPGVQLNVDFVLSPVATCNGLSIGLIDNREKGYDAPSLVASVNGDGKLSIDAQHSTTSIFERVGQFTPTNVTQRLELRVRGDRVSASLNGEGLEPVVLGEPISAQLNAHFFVEAGSCTLVVKRVRMRPVADPEPTIAAGARVTQPVD